MRQTIDKKRVALGLALLMLLAAGIGAWAREAIPKFLAQPQVAENVKSTSDPGKGEVAGSTDTHVSLEQRKDDTSVIRQDLQKQIDEIKKNITQLKPEDIKEQAPVQKILKDLDGIAKQATESVKILDVKGNLCGEVKKRFCQ